MGCLYELTTKRDFCCIANDGIGLLMDDGKVLIR